MANIIGLQSGMVLQRDNGNRSLSYFTVDTPGDVTVSIGTAELLSETDGIRKFRLSGILTGGPYTLTLTVGDEAVTYTDLYVGDVWVLAGQSNMDGCGHLHKVIDHYIPDETIRFYSIDGLWKVGEPRLHQNHRSKDEFVKRYLGYNLDEYWQHRGVGPGYAFAKEMKNRTAVPQGLISCALGGSGLGHWDPTAPLEPEPNLYGIMLRKYRECGGNARGLFWYQGCSETGATHVFTENMIRLVEACRRDFERPDLAFVQVQLYVYVCCDPDGDPNWNSIREQQRTLADKIENMDTVAITDAVLADGIHLESTYHEKLGKNAAESMFHLCFDPYGMTSVLAPQLDTVYAVPGNGITDFGQALAVKYKNLHGPLTSEGRPTGYAISTQPNVIDKRHILRVDLFRDTAYIRHELPYDVLKNGYLFYFFGNNTYANITDSDGRPLPGMGPISLAEYLK